MRINEVKRFWIKSSPRKKGANDSFYHSSTWTNTRKIFMASEPHIQLPPINMIPYQNKYCADCWEKGKINDERIEVDHVISIDDGCDKTELTNLRSRCHAHHNSKTHEERKARVQRETKGSSAK